MKGNKNSRIITVILTIVMLTSFMSESKASLISDVEVIRVMRGTCMDIDSQWRNFVSYQSRNDTTRIVSVNGPAH